MHDPHSLVSVHEDQEGHHFDLENVKILAHGSTKHAREFLEAWFSTTQSINRHIELDAGYATLLRNDRQLDRLNPVERVTRPTELRANSLTPITHWFVLRFACVSEDRLSALSTDLTSRIYKTLRFQPGTKPHGPLLGSTIDGDLDSQWAHIKDALVSASIDTCGVTRHPPKHWISADSLSLMDRRPLLPSDSKHIEEHQYLGRELRRSLQMDGEAWWCELAREMELASLCGNTRKLFHLIRVTEGVRSGISETICEEDGTLITNLQRRLERWAEHFGSQFSWPPATSATSDARAEAELSTPTDPPSSQEIEQELRHMKRYKAPGPDGLPPAPFKDGVASLVRELTTLFSKIWSNEEVPSSWGEEIVVPIFKKGLRTVCPNYRGISLVPVVCKLLVSIILRKLSPTRETLQREEQAGFRPGRGCIDQIFTPRQILELRHAYQRPTIAVFIDICAVFDSVDRTALWHCLLRNGVPETFVSILRAVYSLTSDRVRAYGKLSPTFVVYSGVRQGCPISPFLFNFAIEDVLKNPLGDSLNAGVELLPGSRVVDLDYADDIVLLGDDPHIVQLALNRLAIEASKYGMYFSPSKCKALFQDWQVPLPALTLAGATLEVVESFVYLGSCITAGGAVGDEISMRISRAGLAFPRLRYLWRRHDIRLSIKGWIYCATVRAVLLYGCETWLICKDDLHKLSVFEHRCLQSITPCMVAAPPLLLSVDDYTFLTCHLHSNIVTLIAPVCLFCSSSPFTSFYLASTAGTATAGHVGIVWLTQSEPRVLIWLLLADRPTDFTPGSKTLYKLEQSRDSPTVPVPLELELAHP
ncbi:unnamed protein product [Dicrocoelium dendriticum]|nr:unnamed protein product [Dicrocoelium dendriticum]